MAFTSDRDFSIPLNELLEIKPEPRQKIFLKLLADYKKMIPSLIPICAHLNWGNYESRTHEIEFHRKKSWNDSSKPQICVPDVNDLASDIDYVKAVKNNKDRPYTLSLDDSTLRNVQDGSIIEVITHNHPCDIDYFIIFKSIADGKEIIFFDAPYIFTNRSICGYRYCLRENKTRDFFIDAIHCMTRMSRPKFDEYIENICELSLEKNDKLYWRNKDNFPVLMEHLIDLQIRFVRSE